MVSALLLLSGAQKADEFSVSCSYQCLRMMNYVAQPTIEVIQILLIISNVLSYNMNAGASYTLLGEFSSFVIVVTA